MSCASPRSTCPPWKGDALHLECWRQCEEAVGKGRRIKQGCGGSWGASVGDAACMAPISRCRLSKPSDSCRLPGYRNGDWEPFFTQQESVDKYMSGEKPDQPLKIGSTGLHIHQTRPNVSRCMGPRERVVNICSRIQKVSWPCFSPSLFCFSCVSSVPFHSPLFASSVPIPTIRWTRVIFSTEDLITNVLIPEHPLRTTPSRIPTIRWMNRWSCLPIRKIHYLFVFICLPSALPGSSCPH